MTAPELCTFCTVRHAGFTQRNTHLSQRQRDDHARNLARACCTLWRGREPEEWTGGRWIR